MKSQILKINRIGFLIVNLLICYNLAISQVVNIKNGVVVKLSKAGALSFSNGTSFSINSAKCVFDGTIVFTGTQDQNIGGTQNIKFANLSINNSSLVTLLHDVEIRNKLSLNSGVLNLLDNNLLIKGNAVIDGTFSQTSMIAADSKGRLYKELIGVGSYYFPVGDLTDLPDFSPVTLEFKTGKFSRAIVSVNLKNSKHPLNTSTSNYLKRYWSIRQSGILGFTCDAKLTYVNSDIFGNESNINGAIWNGSQWVQLNPASGNQITGKLSLLSDVTGIQKYSTTASTLKSAQLDIVVTENGISLITQDYVQLQKIEIYNKAGQLVYSKRLESEENPELGLDLVADLYLIKIMTNQSIITKKVFLP